jgi:hypothetical protein
MSVMNYHLSLLYISEDQIAHDLAMLALVWLHMLRFSSTIHAQIKDNLTYLSAKLNGKKTWSDI